ncbi:MAG: hypothetical protein KH230_01865 [Enterocloster asparagiformis]|nr:hypothetical protein [Enterocloster asparagiformis]
MISILTWFSLSCKRYLRRLSFLLILLLFPFGAMAFKQVEAQEHNKVRIAVYAEDRDEDSLGQELARRLLEYGEESGQNGMFEFYLCDTALAVREEVAARRAECGYVIYEGLRERLDNRDIKRCIGVYSSPSTVVDRMSTETVFSLLIEMYDRILLEQYVAEGEAFAGLDAKEGARELAAQEAGRLYQMFLDNQSTFHFEYETAAVNAQEAQELAETAQESIFPARGLAAVYVFTTGLYGAVTLCQDEKRGLFQPLPGRLRGACRFASLAAPVALAALSGLAALWLAGAMGAFGREAAILGVYVLAVAAFSSVLKATLRSGPVICCLIPFFIIGSLIFCPVFLDTGRLVPEVERVGRLFLPYYYLRMF